MPSSLELYRLSYTVFACTVCLHSKLQHSFPIFLKKHKGRKDWLNIFALAFISFFTHFPLITPRTNLTTRVICAALWSDRVQLVAMYLKSSLIIHPLVWASQLLLFVLAVIRGWGRTRCHEVASILESHLMLFVCVCVCVKFKSDSSKRCTVGDGVGRRIWQSF